MPRWRKVPRGASGSSTTRTRLRAPSGTPVQRKGGIRFSPSRAKVEGILSPSAKAGLVSVRAIASSRDWSTICAGERELPQIVPVPPSPSLFEAAAEEPRRGRERRGRDQRERQRLGRDLRDRQILQEYA